MRDFHKYIHKAKLHLTIHDCMLYNWDIQVLARKMYYN